MAYVGTAKRRGSARETLASIIAGEAGNEGTRGMQAVASVIQNRANSNFSGYGSDYVSQATARRQFQGQATPTKASYAVADQLLSGNLQDVTGGALYYANPGASTARWARNLDSGNALQIGNHYFTDNTRGVPFSGNGAVAQNASSNNEVNIGGGGMGDPSASPDAGGKLGWSTPASDPRWVEADLNGDGDVTVTELKEYNARNEAGTAASSGDAGSEGQAWSVPKAIVSAADQQSKAAISAAETLAKTETANTEATNTTNTGIFSGFTSWAGNRLLQIFVFVIAAIFILIGLYIFATKANIKLELPGKPA